MNIENYTKVLNYIKDNPEQWQQPYWHCESAHCFAGLCQILAGKSSNDITAAEDACEYLGVHKDIGDWLFDPYRTLKALEWFLSFAIANARPDGQALDTAEMCRRFALEVYGKHVTNRPWHSVPRR